MLFSLIVFFFVSLSSIETIPSISFFYPRTIDELSCTNGYSWTRWFNSAHPPTNVDFDQELVSVIQLENGRDICLRPQGVQAQSVTTLTNNTEYGAIWRTIEGTVSAFVSRSAGVDFRVRFCCGNNDFITTTSTTPRPVRDPFCGRAEIQPSFGLQRIFGGSKAVPHSWPWQILYEEEKICAFNQTCVDNCGGTVLNRFHVLTAAHCIGGKNLSKIRIIAGVHNRLNRDVVTWQMRNVEKIFFHPDWKRPALVNDLAIIRLNQPIQFNRYVQPVCLPGPDPQPNSNTIIIGWGAEEYGGRLNNELKQTQVKVISQCYKYWNQFDDDNQICVGETVTGNSACQGDSGGPLLQNYNGQWILQGVASFVDECKTNGNLPPNIYTKVSSYLTWIDEIIQ